MIIHPNIDPVAISLGPIDINWYGIMYLLGFLSAFFLAKHRIASGQTNWKIAEVHDIMFYIILGVILGGRIGHVLFYQLPFHPDFVLSNPLEIFKVWKGGMSFHGGLLGVVIAVWLYTKRYKKNFIEAADFFVLLAPAGLFFGRIGNFINQELWGRLTDVPWGVLFATKPDGARHPSQIYEAAWEGLFIFIVLWWFAKKKRGEGFLTGLFLLSYGFGRFVIEFFREADFYIGYLFVGLSIGQWLCVPMIIIGVWLINRSFGHKS